MPMRPLLSSLFLLPVLACAGRLSDLPMRFEPNRGQADPRVQYLARGADLRVVRLTVAGVDRIGLDSSGDLLLEIGGAVVRQPKPMVYQESDERLDGPHILAGKNQVGFEAPGRDRRKVLTIDPVLVYPAFVGGNRTDFIWDVTLDSLRNLYLTGATESTDFPVTTGAMRTSLVGGYDGFVTKLNPATGALVYSSYLGGSKDNDGNAIKVDAQGQAYVAGLTYSDNFPITPGAFHRAHAGRDFDAFVAKVDVSGAYLHYATYLGGGLDDVAWQRQSTMPERCPRLSPGWTR